jgi:cobalt-zinc-cadmium efflux system outer membrane protein
MKPKMLFSLILFGCVALHISGEPLQQPTGTVETNLLSLDQVVSAVISNNPSLKAARANWEAMKERIPQARAWEDPRAGFDFKAGRFVNVQPNSFTDQSLMLEQTLPLSGKNRLRGEAASAEAVNAFAEFHRRKLDATARARMAYYRLANAYAQLEINRKNSALLKQFTEITRTKYEVGTHSQADVLSAETELAKLEETAFDFQRQISEAQTQLNTLMNLPAQAPLGHPTAVTFKPLSLALEKLEGLALAHRPELLIAAKKIDAAQARLNAAHKEWIPEPSVRVQADRYNGASQVISEVSAGFSINLPWFNRAKYKAGIQENQKMLESAQHELEATRSETLGMVKDQYKKLETFHHHTELFKNKLLPLSEQTVTSKRLSYETDKASFLELLTAQQTVQEIESMYWNHLTDYQIALAELEALIGTVFQPVAPTTEHQHISK